MKKLLITLSLIIPFLLPIAAHADITSGLIGWWKFDEGSGTTISDSSGYGLNGTLSNDPYPSWVAGKIGPNALAFNGSNFGVTTAAEQWPQSGFTISAWINTNDVTQLYIIGAMYNNGGNAYAQFIFNNNSLGLQMQDGAADANSIDAIGPLGISNGTWHLVTATWNGGTVATTSLKLYMDGVEIDNSYGGGGSFTGPYSGSDLPFSIATQYPNYNPTIIGFNGSLDDVRLYNRALSGADVMQLYNYTGISHQFYNFIIKVGKIFNIKKGTAFIIKSTT